MAMNGPGSQEVQEARENRVCRICGEPLDMPDWVLREIRPDWPLAWDRIVDPIDITLDKGQEFAHTACVDIRFK